MYKLKCLCTDPQNNQQNPNTLQPWTLPQPLPNSSPLERVEKPGGGLCVRGPGPCLPRSRAVPGESYAMSPAPEEEGLGQLCPLQAKEGLPGGHRECDRVPCREAQHCPVPRCPEPVLDAQGQGGLRVPTRGREDRADSGQGREPGGGQTWAETASATASAREGQGPAGGASSRGWGLRVLPPSRKGPRGRMSSKTAQQGEGSRLRSPECLPSFPSFPDLCPRH